MMPIKNIKRAKLLQSIDWSSSSLIVVDGKGIFKSKYGCYVLFYE